MATWAPSTWKIADRRIDNSIFWARREGAKHAYVMCSHVLEHLDSDKCRDALSALDALVAPGGVLVIASPYPWAQFYCDLSHVRPYQPEVFIRYLCEMTSDASADPVSQAYTVEGIAREWEPARHWRGDYVVEVAEDEAEDRRLWEARTARKLVVLASWLMVLRKGAK